MKTTSSVSDRSLRLGRSLFFLAVGILSAPAQTNESTNWDKDFVKTNGEYVIIGGHVMIPTNSPSNCLASYVFMWREEVLRKILKSYATNRLDRFVEGTWALAKEYPARLDMYYDLKGAMEDYYDHYGDRAKAGSLAKELAHSAAPESINGLLRFDNVRAGDEHHPVGDTTSLESKIKSLLLVA